MPGNAPISAMNVTSMGIMHGRVANVKCLGLGGGLAAAAGGDIGEY